MANDNSAPEPPNDGSITPPYHPEEVQEAQPAHGKAAPAVDQSSSGTQFPPDHIKKLTEEIKIEVLNNLKALPLTPSARDVQLPSPAVPLPFYRPPSPFSTSTDTSLSRGAASAISSSLSGRSSHASRITDPRSYDEDRRDADDKTEYISESYRNKSEAVYLRHTKAGNPRGKQRLEHSTDHEEETVVEKIWGPLFDHKGNPTPRLGQFLRGLALHLIEDYDPKNSMIISPAKMRQFYKQTKLEVDTYWWDDIYGYLRDFQIAKIYLDLECEYHLVQAHSKEPPQVPGLTPEGFEKWMTCMIQAYPYYESRRLARVVRDMLISNADDRRERFPRELSLRLFPEKGNMKVRKHFHAVLSAVTPVRLLVPPLPGFPPPRKDLPTGSLTHQPAAEQNSRSATLLTTFRAVNAGPPKANTEVSPRPAEFSYTAHPFSTKDVDNPLRGSASSDADAELRPIILPERERKTYVAKPGTGKTYDDWTNTKNSPKPIISDLKRTKPSTVSAAVDANSVANRSASTRSNEYPQMNEGSFGDGSTQTSDRSQLQTFIAATESFYQAVANTGVNQRVIDDDMEELMKSFSAEKPSSDYKSESNEVPSQLLSDPKVPGSSGSNNDAPKSPSGLPEDPASRTESESQGRSDEQFVLAEKPQTKGEHAEAGDPAKNKPVETPTAVLTSGARQENLLPKLSRLLSNPLYDPWEELSDEEEQFQSAIEDDDDVDEEWDGEDEASDATPPIDEKEMFQRVGSRPNLTSRRSLLTSLINEEDRASAWAEVEETGESSEALKSEEPAKTEETKPEQSKPADDLSSLNDYSTLKSCWSAIQSVRSHIGRIFRPKVASGYRRIEWTCTCGELLYADFKESSQGSLDSFAAELRRQASDSSSGGSLSSRTASSTLTGSSRPSTRSSISLVGWKSPRDAGASSSQTDVAESQILSASNPPVQQTLELSINSSRFAKILAEVDVKTDYTDGLLFENIRKRYLSTTTSMLPLQSRFSRPAAAIYVKLRRDTGTLVSTMSGSLLSSSIPPQSEVEKGRYSYQPCPIDEPPMPTSTFMHYFYYSDPEKHPAKIWGPRLPRKLGEPLTTCVEPLAQGWGVEIQEQPHWAMFTSLIFLLLLLSGVVAGIYAWRTGDHQSGIAIGAWLTSVQAMGVTALFFWWT